MGSRTRILKAFSSGANTLRFEFEIAGVWFERNLTFNPMFAGNTYRIEVRWDSRNPISGANHVCISIDDDTACGYTTTWTPETPAATIYIGSDESSLDPTNAIIEGLTISRLPYYDGSGGIDLGVGDVIASNADKTQLTGPWDIVFGLPTNSSTGVLSSGTGNAWSHPHRANLFPGNAGRGGYMMAGVAATDGWFPEGAPTSLSALANGEKIFAGGYKVLSNAANQGMYQDISIPAGGSPVVARALAHSDTTCQPKLILYDQTNTVEIGSITGTTTSTRTAPDVLMLTGQVPGPVTLRVNCVFDAVGLLSQKP